MREVQKIKCLNRGAYSMAFYVKFKGGKRTARTGYYTNPFDKTIDLKDYDATDGEEMWPDVDILWGTDQSGTKHKVRYKENGKTATYKLTGTTLIHDIELLPGEEAEDDVVTVGDGDAASRPVTYLITGTADDHDVELLPDDHALAGTGAASASASASASAEA
jgi:hypothetical protein